MSVIRIGYVLAKMVMFVRVNGLHMVINVVPVLKIVKKKKRKNLRPAKLVIKPVVINAAPEMKCVRALVVTKPVITVLVLLLVIIMVGNVKVTILTSARLPPVATFPES